MSNQNADHYFLRGGGEMGELIRNKDWSKTTLGDPAGWPQSLCTMVAVMLENPFGMYIAWGSDFTQLYNDAYRPILGATKHPQALGSSTRDTFSEIWHIIESMFDNVMHGKAVGFPELMLPLNRYGFVEECYFDFSYSPIRKDDGEVGGVLVTVLETTNKKKAEEKLKESEERFRDSVRQAPVGITILRGKDYVVEMANDAYLQLIDKAFTEFVGRPLFDSSPEVQESVQAFLDGVLNTGKPFYGNEVPVTVNRYGKQEVLYFDFLYYPLKEKNGEISGILVTVNEVSEKVIARKKLEESEKQQKFLLKISDSVRTLDNPVSIEAAITKLAMDFMGADRCYYNTIRDDNAIVLRDAFREDLTSLAGVYPLSSFAIFKAVIDAGRPFIVDDVNTSDIVDEGLKPLCIQLQVGSFINVPVIKSGKSVGVLSLVQSKPRKWTESEVQLTIETAERIWAAVERAKAEETLLQSKEKYRSLFNSINDAFCIIEIIFDEKGAPVDWIYIETNPAFLLHATVEMKGKRISEIVPEMETFWLEKYGDVAKTGEPVQLEHIVKGLGNQWFQTSASLQGPKGSNRVAVLFRNITERKQTEEKLKESEKQFKNVLLQSPNIFVILEGYPEMIITFANEPLFKSWGRTAAIIGKPLLEVLPEIKDQPFPKLLQQVFETGKTYNSNEEKAVIIKNGVSVATYFNYVYQPIFNDTHKVTGVIIMATDITEQVLARKKIEASKMELQDIFLNTPAAIAIFEGPEYKYVLANKAYEKICNRKAADLLGKNMQDLFPELKGTGTLELFDNVFKTGQSFSAPEHVLMVDIKNDGVLRQCYYNFSIEPLKNDSGEIYAVMAMTYDVTEQVVARKKIEESEQRFHSLVEQAPVAMCVFRGENFVFEVVNEKQLQLLGKTKEQVLNLPVFTAIPEVASQGYKALIEGVYGTGISYRADEAPITLIRNGKEETIYVNFILEPIYNSEQKIDGVFSVTTEVTEQVLAKKQLQESDKKFRSLVEQAPVAMCVVRGDKFVFEMANEKHLQLIGKTKEQVMNLPVFTAMPEVVGQGYEELLAGVYTTGIPFTANESPLTVIRNGKEEINYVNYVFEPLYDTKQKIDGVFCVATDVTEQVLARKKVEVSEFRYQEMIYSSPSMISILKGEEMIIEIANDAVLASWGKGKDVIGQSIFLVLPEVIEQGFDKLLLNVYQTGESFHAYETPANLMRNGTSEIIYYNFIYQAQRNISGKIEGVAILANEVTPQASLNKKIKESEQRYHALFMHSPFAFSIMKGKDMKVTLANDLMLEFWGKGNNVDGKTLLEILPELSNQSFPAMIDSVYTTGVPVYANEMLAHLNRNGIMEDKYFNIVYEPYFEADGTISGVITIAHEVTQQVLARKNIEESETLFKLALFLTAKTVFKQDTQLKYTWIYNTHPTFEMKELVGKTDSDLFSNDAAEILTTIKQTVLNTGNTFNGDIQIEIDGKPFDFAMMVEATKDVAGKINGIIAVSDDITEKKKAENKIKESEQEIRKIKEQLELSIRAGKIGIWHWDIKNDQLYWSKEQKVIYGLEQSAELLNVAQYKALVIPEDWEQLNKDLQSAPTAEDQEYDFRIIRKNDGEIRWIKSRARNILDPQGALQFISGVNIDITEQVLALNKIQASEEKFKRLVLQAPVAICVLRGEDYVIETMNAGMCAIWDRTLDQVLNKQVFDVFPEVRDQGIKELLDNVYFTGERFVVEELSINLMRNGKLDSVFVTFVYEPLREADGTVSGIMALAHEITEQVVARKKVEESEKKFEAAILAVEGIIWTNNAEGEMIGEQPGWANLTGQQFEEYQGYGWSKAIHPDDAQPTVDAWNQAVATNSTFEFEHKLKTVQNEWRLFSVKAVPAVDKNGVVQQWVGVHTDITEQKLAQEKLAYRTALLEAHNEANVDGVLLVDSKGKILSFNQRFIEIWNIPPDIAHSGDDDAALSFAMTQLVNPQQFIDIVRYLYDHPTERCLDELEFKDGKIIERNGYSVVGEDSVYYACSWIFRDITAQKNSEKIITESEKRFRLLADSMPQHIWTADPAGNLNYYNQSVFDYSGLTADQLDKDGWLQIVHPEDREENEKKWISSIITGDDFVFEHRFRRHDGEYFWQLSRAIPQKDENGNIQMWVGTSTNIQEQKTFANELEREVLKRTKELETINIELERKNNDLESFAYVSSHDLQEPLRKIQTFASRIIEREYEVLSDNAKDNFRRMQDAASRMQTLIQDLLVYSKTNITERVFVNIHLNTIIEEVKEDLSEEIKDKHAIIETTDLCVVKIIPFQFRQLMHNLIGNALKFSLPDIPPHIKIKSRIVSGISLHNEKLNSKGKYCHITISDNGIGFEQEYSEKIFEVFQRLHGRREYNGTGIGLSIVKKIVENHEGVITAKSELSKGATFDIYIPAA